MLRAETAAAAAAESDGRAPGDPETPDTAAVETAAAPAAAAAAPDTPATGETGAPPLAATGAATGAPPLAAAAADRERADKQTAEKLAFIQGLRERGTVYHAAESAGICRDTAYQWRKRDPEFAKAWEQALDEAVETLEASLYERALHERGMPGVISGLAWLKAHKPEKWNEKMQTTVIVERPGDAALAEFSRLMGAALAARQARRDELALSAPDQTGEPREPEP